MFKLPFHFSHPLATGFFTLAVCLHFVFFRWSYNRGRGRAGAKIEYLFNSLYARLGPKKARKVVSGFLLAMAIIFGAVTAFALATGTGLITNGDMSSPF
jgi:hypothetical protein